MAYCETTDLLIGDTRLSDAISPEAFIKSAADEIDSAIGYMYITPIVVDDNAVNRPTALLLKTINMWLATGRIILTISRTGEDNTLDALGKYYVNMALQRLNDIATGKIDLVGVGRTQEAPTYKGPTIVNAEESSIVDSFYNFTNPSNAEYWKDLLDPLGTSRRRPGPII